MMKHFADEWIKEWCQENGWTDLTIERYNNYWAFPPGAVMPEPIPSQTLRQIKIQKGLCPEEKNWLLAAISITFIAAICSFLFRCPIPIVFAFAFGAVTAAKLEVEEI